MNIRMMWKRMVRGTTKAIAPVTRTEKPTGRKAIRVRRSGTASVPGAFGTFRGGKAARTLRRRIARAG